MGSNPDARQGLLEDRRPNWLNTTTRKPVQRPLTQNQITRANETRTGELPFSDHERRTTPERAQVLENENRLSVVNFVSEAQLNGLSQREPTHPAFLENTTGTSVRNSADSPLNIGETATWRPKWLHPVILGSFTALFLFFTISLAVMLWYSQRNNGLLKTQQSFVYIWRFGPTAILTIVAIFWARVELQAMIYMPWIALRWGRSFGKSGYTVDYTSMIPPTVLFRSFQNQHYLVFLAAVTSIFLKAEIVLAPGLYSLTTFKGVQNLDVRVLDEFDADNEVEFNDTTSIYPVARTLKNFDMVYPYGVTESVAYQTFHNANDSKRGNITNLLTAVVDGFFYEVACLKLEDYSIVEQKPNTRLKKPGYVNITIDLHFEGCNTPVTIPNDEVIWPDDRGHATYWVFNSFHLVNNIIQPQRPCQNLPQQNPQFIQFGAYFKPTDNDSSILQVEKAAAVICSPSVWLSKVEVTDDGINPNVTVIPNQPKRPVAANPWGIFERLSPNVGGPTTRAGLPLVNGPVEAYMTFRGLKPDPIDLDIYTNEVFYDSVMNLTEIYRSLIGHYFFRREVDLQESGSGSIVTSADRLVVNRWVCLSMMALSTASAVLVSFLLIRYNGHTAIWHRNPASIIGNMIFFRDHPNLVRAVVSPSSHLRFDWGRCNYTPIVLRVWIRMLFLLFVIIVAVGLVVSLRISESSSGLASINDDGYIRLLWTSLPALLALGISLFIGSCDKAYRDLSTLFRLKEDSCGALDLDISILDMLGIRALHQSVRQRLWSITLSQSLAIVSGVLTTLVSVLFTVDFIPDSEPIQFHPKTWFNSDNPVIYDALLKERRSLVNNLFVSRLEGNLTYPKHTFDDLMFPNLGGTENLDHSQNLSVRLNTPAAKLQRSCHKLLENEYSISLNESLLGHGYLPYKYYEPMRCPNGTMTNYTADIRFSVPEDHNGSITLASPFLSPFDLISINQFCNLGLNNTFLGFNTSFWRSEQYFWATFSTEKMDFESSTVWRCNYSWVEVATEVNLVVANGDLVIDPKHPPRPDLSTIRPWDPPFDVPPLFPEPRLAGGQNNLHPVVFMFGQSRLFEDNARFHVLMKPYGPFTPEVFEDSGQDEAILNELHHNYAFLAAQLANIQNRVDIGGASEANATFSRARQEVDAVVANNSRRRLVQNPKITYIVVGILGAVVAVNIWALVSVAIRRFRSGRQSWLLDMDVKNLAPDGFHSIAAMANLLHDSNVSDHLPSNTELLSSDELHGQMSDLNFRLGWFHNESKQKRVYTVGVTGDDDFTFVHKKEDWDQSS